MSLRGTKKREDLPQCRPKLSRKKPIQVDRKVSNLFLRQCVHMPVITSRPTGQRHLRTDRKVSLIMEQTLSAWSQVIMNNNKVLSEGNTKYIQNSGW
jgi:hypothetical protein